MTTTLQQLLAAHPEAVKDIDDPINRGDSPISTRRFWPIGRRSPPMPADLTAPQLIALLREHPGACGMLELRIADDGSRAYSAEFDGLWRDDPPQCIPGFRRWLTGAAVEKCDELGIVPVHTAHGWMIEGNYGLKGEPKLVYYPTRLHAALAALEQHAKKKSNG